MVGMMDWFQGFEEGEVEEGSDWWHQRWMDGGQKEGMEWNKEEIEAVERVEEVEGEMMEGVDSERCRIVLVEGRK